MSACWVRPAGSYAARHVGEAGVELALAGAAGRQEAVVAEAADLLYHLLVLLKLRGLALAALVQELERRHAARR